jgi:hypothetical protein
MAFLKPKVMAVAPAKKGAAKPSRALDLVPGWAELCALDACAKALTGLLALKKTAVTAAVEARLKERGLQRRGKPDTMSLAEGEAAGSAYLRRRDSRSPVTPDELLMLSEHLEAEKDAEGNPIGIPGFTETIESTPELLAINPLYASDELLLARVDKALSGISGIPDDFVVQIPAQQKVVVSDVAWDSLFREPAGVVEQLFSILGAVTLRPVFKDIEAAWNIVRPMLKDAPEEPKRQRSAPKGLSGDALTVALRASLDKEDAA